MHPDFPNSSTFMPTPAEHPSFAALRTLFAERIAILDGAMGSMVQTYSLNEEDFRGERFRDFPHDLKGNNDLLSLTKPAVIEEIHAAYFAAGADIVETNTFSATTIGMADYHLESIVTELNTRARPRPPRPAAAASWPVPSDRSTARSPCPPM
jgi:5-methyltetrahydrofolate--homocysteine methyltransferase